MNGKTITHSVLPVQAYLPARSAIETIEKKILFCNVDNVIGIVLFFSSFASFPLLNVAKGNWKITSSILNLRNKTFCFPDFLSARNLQKFPVLCSQFQTKDFKLRSF